MPCKSPEAIARRRAKEKARKAAKKAAAQGTMPVHKPSPNKLMFKRAHVELTKAQMYQMLADAVRNTCNMTST